MFGTKLKTGKKLAAKKYLYNEMIMMTSFWD